MKEELSKYLVYAYDWKIPMTLFKWMIVARIILFDSKDSNKDQWVDIKVDRVLCPNATFRLKKKEDSPVRIQPLA